MGTTLPLPASWKIAANGATPVYASAVAAVTQAANSGAPTTGGTYNFGTTAGTERAVGAMTSGSFTSPNNYLAYYTNTGTTNISALQISYSAERYRVNTATASIEFFYSTNGTAWTAVTAGDIAASSFPTGTSAYNFASPLTVSRSFTIPSLSLAPSAAFYLRWQISTVGGNSQGIAIDDISVTASYAAACSGPTTASTSYSSGNVTTTSATLSWLSGNGTARVAFLKAGTFTAAVPATNTTYTASPSFTATTSSAFDGGKTVYNDVGSSVAVTDLTPNTVYNVKVFEYLGAAGSECYLNTPLTGSVTTLSNPAATTAASAVSGTGFTANWTAPSGNGAAAYTYTLEVATDNAFTTIVSTSTNIASGTTSQAVTGLTASSPYFYRVTVVNNAGNSATSNITSVTTAPAAPPTPTAAANPSCGPTTLNAYTGTGSSTYYWQGTNATGTSTASPATVDYPVPASGTYYVRAYDNGNNLWSAASSLAVTIASNPTLTTQPTNKNIGAGSTTTFSVTASNAGSYNWQENSGSGWTTISNGGVYSTATTATLTLTGAMLSMNGYQYRAVVGATSPCTQAATSSAATLTVTPTSALTDYFRSSGASGGYGTAGSWESSSDSVSWITATAAPTSSARAITIQAGHTITISNAGSGTQIRIRNGGNLTYTSGSFTVGNGAGDDLIVEAGGRLVCGSSTFSLDAGAIVRVQTNGTAATNSSTTLVSSSFGASSSYFFENNAVLEYTGTSQPGIGNVTFFPASADYPILRFTSTLAGNIGNANPTTINGRLDVPAGITVGFTNTGTKTIKGGITNDGTVSFGASTALQITGANAVLGGTGPLSIGSTGGLTIPSGASVVLSSNKTIDNGTITVNGAFNANGYVLSGTTALTTGAGATLRVTSAAGISPSGTTGSIQSSGTRTYNPNATYEYNGVVAQSTGAGLPATVANLIINNPAGVTLTNAATTISGNLALTSGTITSSAANTLTLASATTFTGGSPTAYVAGPLIRNTAAASAYAFPIGKNGLYVPVTVTPSATTATAYTAEYFRSATPDYQSVTTPLVSVDATNWFEISRSTGGADATIALSYGPASNVTDYTTLTVAHRPGAAGTAWVSEGGSVTGTNSSGTVTSNLVSSFSPFAIGATTAQPLPLKLVTFQAARQEQSVVLSWELTGVESGEQVLVQRSQDGQVFSTIATNTLKKGDTRQTYTDEAPGTGVSYYRIAVKSTSGTAVYSQTLAVHRPLQVGQLQIYPNPAIDQLVIETSSVHSPILLTLTNMTGQQVWNGTVNRAGRQELSIRELPAGMYFLRAYSGTDVQVYPVQITH